MKQRADSLVGRNVELVRMCRALDAAAAGRGSCWFLLGVAGSGKTRLASELLEEARTRGLAVLSGGPSGVIPSAAYGVIAQALRSHLRGARPVGARLDPYTPGLAAVLPEWPEPSPTNGFNADQRRLLAAEGTFRLLLELAERSEGNGRHRGAILFLDDLQWSDPESLEVLHHLAIGAREAPTMVVCAVRQGESSQAEALARRLAQQRDAELMELPALSSEDVESLLRDILDASPPGPLVAEIARRSGGLPLFVEEILEAYLAAGAVSIEQNTVVWSGSPPEIAPPSMASWVQPRLARVGAEAGRVVAAAAILDRFDAALEELSGAPPDEVQKALHLALEAALITRTPSGLRFHHELTREAVVQSLLPSQRDDLHRRAAQVLARRQASPEEQARHWEAIGERGRAAALLVQAARRNLDKHALATAEDLASHALELAPSGESALAARDALAASLSEQGRWNEALDIYRQLITAGWTDASVVERMVDTCVHAGRIEEAGDLLSSAAGCDLPAPVRMRLEAGVALGSGRLKPTVELAEMACEVALASGDLQNACTSLDVLGRALDLLGRHYDAAEAFRRWAAIAEEGGLTTSRLHALVSLGGHQLLRGLPVTALWDARALGLQVQSYLHLGWAELNLTYALFYTRPAAEAAALADEAVTRARRSRLDVLPHLLVAAAFAHLPLDRSRGETLLREGLERRPDDDLLVIAECGRGYLAFCEGRYDAAAAHWQGCVEAMQSRPGGTPNDAPAALPLALLAAGKKEEALEALHVARQWPVHAFEYCFEGLIALTEVLIDDRAEQVVPATEPLRAPEPFFRAGALAAAATISSDPCRESWLREALDQFTWGGWERSAAHVRRLLRSAGAPVPRARRSAVGLPDGLRRLGVTRREADTLGLVAAGLGNAAIAEQLYVSVRTVESHVSSLLAKLNAANRTELASRYLDYHLSEESA